MKVRLMNSIDAIKEMEHNAAYAMLTCHANTDKLQNEEPSVFIKRAINLGHESILEHITLSFEVNKLSRACLQELARHRHISLSVESTRHTLEKKITDDDFVNELLNRNNNFGLSEKVDDATRKSTLSRPIWILKEYPDLSNDELKYFLPEFWPTNLVLTTNVRELRHIFKLRSDPEALQEFQRLCVAIFYAIPEEYRYLIEDCIYHEEEN